MQDAESRYRFLVEQSPDGIVLIEPETARILEFNDTAHRQLGYSREEFARLNISDLEDAETPEETAARIARVTRNGRDDFDTRHRTRQGDIRNVHVTAQATTMLGRPVYHCVWRDITERKIADAALIASETRYRRLFESARDGILILDAETGMIVDVNPYLIEILGFSRDAFLDKKIWDLGFFRDIIANLDAFAELQQHKYVRYDDKPLETHDGRRIDVEFVSNVYTVNHHDVIQCNIRDITERKRAGKDRATLEAQLQQAQKMESVGRLAGGVAHDFNNMLGVILGHAELALTQLNPSESLHADLTAIREAAIRSAGLTRQLLAFARKQTIAPKILDLNHAVAGMLTMLQRLIGENIDLQWRPEADLWPVKMDPSQLDQILANLCVNAKDAISGVGKITIETENCTFNADYCAVNAGFTPGEYTLLAFSDDGCGMGKDVLPHLFEPFFTTKEPGQGTGLGLATVYGIVKQNAGFINVYSELDHGTTFKIYLPRHAGEAGGRPSAGAGRPAQGGEETILLVEDEPALLKLTKKMLERQGYTVVAASTPAEAIRLSQEQTGTIALIIVDVILPEMSGRTLASTLLAGHANLKCLFMSGYTADAITHHGVLDAGVHFIQKPFSTESLASKVRETLEAPD